MLQSSIDNDCGVVSSVIPPDSVQVRQTRLLLTSFVPSQTVKLNADRLTHLIDTTDRCFSVRWRGACCLFTPILHATDQESSQDNQQHMASYVGKLLDCCSSKQDMR